MDALFCLGRIQLKLERHGIAYNLFKRCEQIAPQHWQPKVNIALSLISNNRLTEAEDVLHRVLKMEPRSATALNNLALISVSMCRPEKAIEYADRALEIDPDMEEARETRGYACLMLGRFEEGWKGYEAQLGGKYRRVFSLTGEPYWRGEVGGRLYLEGEQGMGDEICFASALPDASRDNEIVFGCSPRLTGLMKRSFPQVEVHGTRWEKHKTWIGGRKFDYHALIGSLMTKYRNRREDFPGTPFLTPDPERRIQWRALLDTLPGKKVGIAWTGGLKNTFAHRRSLQLDALKPVLDLPGISFVSLQYKDADVEDLAKRGIHHWPRAVDKSVDYDETAALVAELDAVVTVQTATAHLCGAIGQKAFVLLPSKPRWFWQMEGKSIPWYQSCELFRQTDKWPVDLVAKRLTEYLEKGR